MLEQERDKLLTRPAIETDTQARKHLLDDHFNILLWQPRCKDWNLFLNLHYKLHEDGATVVKPHTHEELRKKTQLL